MLEQDPSLTFFNFGHLGALWAPKLALKSAKSPKIAIRCHKQVWCLQTGGTKWNKGGTSQGTSPVMHWNRFSGQGGPYGCARGPPKRPKLPKTAFLGHKRVWWLQTGGTKWNKGGTRQGISLVITEWRYQNFDRNRYRDIFSDTKFSETETFFRDQIFPKPKPILFSRDQIFRNRNRDFFSTPNYPKPRLFITDQNLRNRNSPKNKKLLTRNVILCS